MTGFGLGDLQARDLIQERASQMLAQQARQQMPSVNAVNAGNLSPQAVQGQFQGMGSPAPQPVPPGGAVQGFNNPFDTAITEQGPTGFSTWILGGVPGDEIASAQLSDEALAAEEGEAQKKGDEATSGLVGVGGLLAEGLAAYRDYAGSLPSVPPPYVPRSQFQLPAPTPYMGADIMAEYLYGPRGRNWVG